MLGSTMQVIGGAGAVRRYTLRSGILVAKSPAVGAWAPMTLQSVAIRFVLEDVCGLMAMAWVPIIVWQNTTALSLHLSMSDEQGLDI